MISGADHHNTLNIWSRGKQFCFPESPMFPEMKSRETLGLDGLTIGIKTFCRLLLLLSDCLRESLNIYSKARNVWSLGKLG